MPNPNTASSPEGSAGEGGLAKAFEAAIADVGLPDDSFHAAAGDPEPELEETDEQPVTDEEKPEPEAKPAAKPIKVKAHVREKVEKTAAPAQQAPTLTAPANWDATRKAAFDKLPTPEAKQVMLEMAKGFEAEYGKKSTQLADAERYARSVYQTITPQHREQMRAAGLKSDAEGIARLIEINDAATKDFPNYARWAIGQFAGDAPIADVLQQIFPEAFTGTTQPAAGQQPAQRPQVDPLIKQVLDEVRAAQQRLDGFEQRQTEAQRAQELQYADRAIAKFRAEVDDAGNPRHPYLSPELEAKMVGLLQTPDIASNPDLGERLQLAYDAAIGIVPNVRQQFLDSEKQRWLAEQTKAADVNKARRARAPISAPPAGPATKPQKGIDGALRQAMNLHGI